MMKNTILIMYFTFFFLLNVIFHLPPNSEGRSFNISLVELNVGQEQTFVLNDKIIYIIEILNISDVIERVPPRIYVKCEDCNESHPLLVTVAENKGVLSWELPVVIESNNYHSVYKNIQRTLCPFDIKSMSNNVLEEIKTRPVIIELSTSSHLNQTVELLVNSEENFVLQLNENKTVQITPTTPAFYLFEFPPENVTSVLLEVSSEDDHCLIVSVQNVSCPVFDLEENIAYRGHYQTVTRRGGFTLTKEEFPSGFYVVLVVSGGDTYCSSVLLNSPHSRSKNVVVNLSETISVQDYIIAVCVTLLIITLFCTVMFIIFFCLLRKEKKLFQTLDIESEEFGPSTSATEVFDDTTKGLSTPYTFAPDMSPCLNTDNLSVKTDSSLDETDFDMVNDAESDKNIYRMKSFMYVCDLARKNEKVIKKKSNLYLSSLITVSIFYFLPVIQLVYSDQYILNQSGKEDMCYYNVLCSHPLWWFSDFNHIFSNIGYIVFGVLFIILTLMKEKFHESKIQINKKLCKLYGIPQHFGLMYAMGGALIVEGIMSSCYHLCPNHYNFQFDTSFMYVICTLCMVKIYQTRHPDINASAYTTFSLLAGVIFIGMYGVFSSNLTFWITFTIVHLSTCVYLSLKIYYMGRWKWQFVSLIRWVNEFHPCRTCDLHFFQPMFPSRFVLLAFANICNWGLAIGSFLFEIKNFSSYLLTIFMVNLVLYTAFYILMKFVCKERLPLQSVIYIVLAMLCWAAALYFFLSKTISWRLTPAESRLYNQKCKLLSFYDNHDIWHFISAAAMFFSFMVLLTLDDDLTYVPRSNIVVF